MPVKHNDEPVEGSLGLFKLKTGEPEVKKTRGQRAEEAHIKREILATYPVGKRLADPRTGTIVEVDASAPLGLRPIFKATNAHNHQGSFTLGVDDISKSKVKAYDGRPYGKLAGSEDEVAKRRANRPANPNSRL